VIVIGALTLFNGNLVSYLRVMNQPDSALYYPGAVVIRSRTMGDHEGVLGEHYTAFTSSLLKSTASSSTIQDWYRGQLLANGWMDEGNGTSYKRAAERIRLFFVYGPGYYGYAYGFTDCPSGRRCDTDFPPA